MVFSITSTTLTDSVYLFDTNFVHDVFVHAAITVVIFLILAINLEPFKKAAVHYPSTDSTFMILLSIMFIADIGRDVASREKHLYYSTVTALAFISAITPVLYIALLII